jgi:type II secretory pathway component PulF
VSSLVAISEKAGHLDEVLATLSDFYEASIDANIKILVSLLEPFMLLLMGVMVGIIALSIIVPIYQLTTQF